MATDKQKFHKGDLVRVSEDSDDINAIIIGSYADLYGGDDTRSYTILTRATGNSAWFYERQMTLIAPSKSGLAVEWENNLQDDMDNLSDIDWIFTNGKEVLAKPHGVSIRTLAKSIGVSLWGSSGEGFDYIANARSVMVLVRPFLENNDKAGWLKLCKEATK